MWWGTREGRQLCSGEEEVALSQGTGYQLSHGLGQMTWEGRLIRVKQEIDLLELLRT